MRPSFKDYFFFNSTERRGLVIFVILILIFIAANEVIYHVDFGQPPKKSEVELKAYLAELEAEKETLTIDKKQYNTKADTTFGERESELFPFNPNNISVEQWIALGFSSKQAEVIINYQNKGGSFEVKSDLEKIYVISEEKYRELSPYILLPDTLVKAEPDPSTTKREYEKREEVVVDINTADSLTLLKIYGIGPFYAGKIIQYRTQLGGYVSKNQLLEIWHFSDSMLVALDSNLKLGSKNVVQININTADAEALQVHPYINWNIANSIVNYRKSHGTYQNVAQIKESVLINDSIFVKLEPYLKIK